MTMADLIDQWRDALEQSRLANRRERETRRQLKLALARTGDVVHGSTRYGFDGDRISIGGAPAGAAPAAEVAVPGGGPTV